MKHHCAFHYFVQLNMRASLKWRFSFTRRTFVLLCRSVLERLLGARLVYSKGTMARALSFEYLNRQLVWHELSELLLFLLPLLNVARIKALVMSHLPRMSVPAATSSISGKNLAKILSVGV